VPDSLAKYRPHLLSFFNGMIRKLDKNSWKDAHSRKTIGVLVDNLRQEVVEFEEQLALDKFDKNTLVELMDTSNFAFLTYCVLREEGVGDG
jgi:hypothetical protein